MSQPGLYNIGVGAGIAALGAIVTLGSMAVTGGAFAVVAYGAVLVGGVQLAIGAGQFALFHLRSPEGKQLHFAKIELRALVRSMIAMASADGKLDPSEVGMIAGLYERFVGGTLDNQTITRVANDMMKGDHSIHDELKSTQSQISSSMKDLIIKCCYLVTIADGTLEPNESKRLSELADTLSIPGNRFRMLIAEINAALANDAPAQKRATSN